MPEYRTIQAWTHKESNTIFIGYRERLEDVLKEINVDTFTIISSTSQKRLGFRLRDLAREHKANNESTYSVKFLSGLVTLDNIVRNYASSEGLFNELQVVKDYQFEEWIEKYKTR